MIGIIGYGFVGDAIYYGLTQKGLKDIYVYDPFKFPDKKIEDFKNVQIAFVCVPTPMGQGGKMDESAILDVFNKLSRINYEGIVVLKSTVLPTIVRKLIVDFPQLRIVSNPEFLTQRTARNDFLAMTWTIVGGNEVDRDLIAKFYETVFPGMATVKVSAEAAMMAKYMTNSFFATKVALMNEFFHLWEKLDLGDWNEVVLAFAADGRVGPYHLMVPGPDGHKGFGGKCLSKDLNALTHLASANGIPCNVMAGAWEDNKTFREVKDWLEIEGAVTEEYKEAALSQGETTTVESEVVEIAE